MTLMEENVEETNKFSPKNDKNLKGQDSKDIKTAVKRKESLELTEPTDWKKVKLEKKELRIKRKQAAAANNEIYDLGVKAKKIWEDLRRDDLSKDKRTLLCKQLYQLIQGKAKGIIFAHDTVRVIETLIAVGGDEYRSKLFVELKEDIVELSKNKYSRFFVTKLLKYGTKDQRNVIIKSLYGNVVKLLKHKIACEVVELAYNDHANANQRSFLMQEFFGPKFRHFKDKDIHSLEDALNKSETLKKYILKDVFQGIQPIIEKGVFTNTMIHTLVKDFMIHCSEEDRQAVIESIKEKLLPIIHTRDGARIAMMCLWFSPTKGRKVIIKSMKGHFQKIASEEYGCMVLLAAFDCIDDTVFVSKAILSELSENLSKLISTESGKKVLKYLVAPRDRMFFHPDVINILSKGDGNPYTKKPRELIHKELQEAITEPLLNLVLLNINSWAKDPQWTLFVGAVLKHFSSETSKSVFEKLALICADPYIPDDKEPHFLDLSYSSKLVSYAIKCDAERFKNDRPTFSKILLEVAESELSGWILTNRSCFLLVSLIETEIPDVVATVKNILMPSVKKIQKLSFPGAKILLGKIN